MDTVSGENGNWQIPNQLMRNQVFRPSLAATCDAPKASHELRLDGNPIIVT
jgi:hypothetical protein